MMRNFVALSLLFLLFYLGSCGNSTDPEIRKACPDTTGQNFTFVIDTLGKHPDSIWVNPSILRDIYITNENDVWVVGEINTLSTGYDSLGHYTPPYSAAHWNGRDWEYVRFYQLLNGQKTLIGDINSIWVFSENNLWVASGSIYQKQGEYFYREYTNNPDSGEIVTKLWAASENEIYGVGQNGIIVKYDSGTWTRMESGTDVDLLNVWGVKDAATGKTRVFTAGSRGDREYGVVLELVDGKWLPRFDGTRLIFGAGDDHRYPLGIWAFRDSVYISYSGYDSDNVYRHAIDNFNDYTLIHSETIGAVRSIHGNGYNDFFGAGYLDALFHYNGKSIRNYKNMKDVSKFYSVKQYGDYVFICGKNLYSTEAIVIRGQRN